jgi:hypothetical protein
MGGSGGTFRYDDVNTNDILKKIENSESETDKLNYDLTVNNLLQELLGDFNNRDTDAIQQHISTILKALSNEVDGEIATRFGGSISRHTHVDGLSDVDALIILNKSELANELPKTVLNYFYERLQERFPNTDIEQGDTAVTIHFADGDIQLVPAIKTKTGIKIPDGKQWSNNINPKIFAKALSDLNAKFAGKLIPSIKLIKGVISGFSENCQLRGYHVESLALQIFGDKKVDPESFYKVKNLVTAFFGAAPSLVRSPSRDITGQSNYVDEYLGKKDSIKRLMAADTLDRTFRQIELSDAGKIKGAWEDFFNHLD